MKSLYFSSSLAFLWEVFSFSFDLFASVENISSLATKRDRTTSMMYSLEMPKSLNEEDEDVWKGESEREMEENKKLNKKGKGKGKLCIRERVNLGETSQTERI